MASKWLCILPWYRSGKADCESDDEVEGESQADVIVEPWYRSGQADGSGSVAISFEKCPGDGESDGDGKSQADQDKVTSEFTVDPSFDQICRPQKSFASYNHR